MWSFRPAKGCSDALNARLDHHRSPSFQTDSAGVTDLFQLASNYRKVDLTGTGFLPAGHVSHLDFADPGRRPTDQFDQISLADLRMVEVKHQTDFWAVYLAHKRQTFLGPAKRYPRMIDCGVQVLKNERDVMLPPEIG
jgi:hypothetical protein